MWLETDISQLDVAPKLCVPFKGPYIVYRKLSHLNYELYMAPKKFKLVHHDKYAYSIPHPYATLVP